MTSFLKNFCVNVKLRRERNSFENKYFTVLEKYTTEMERKLNLASDLKRHKDLCIEQKNRIQNLKQELLKLKRKK